MHLLIGNRPYPRKPSQETKDGNFRDLHDRPLTREPYFPVLSTKLALRYAVLASLYTPPENLFRHPHSHLLTLQQASRMSYVAKGEKEYDATGAPVPAAKIHKIRITLTSSNVKNLEKCTSSLMSGRSG